MTRTRSAADQRRAVRRARSSRGAAAVVALVAALACATPPAAVAAGEPQILTAGIDATDRFVVTWFLEPNTTFEFLEFSSVAIANPFVPGSFAGRNVVASFCAVPGDGCTGPPALTAYRAPDRVSRDRRYYVRVNSRLGDRAPLSSGIWVIDPTKPLVPGGGRPTAEPTNRPAVGQPYTPPNRNSIPAPHLELQSPPRTIARLIRDGVRVHVDCPAFVCYAVVALQLGKEVLVFSDTTARPGVRETFVLRPRPARRALLRRRTRARLIVSSDVSQPGGKRTVQTRRFTVRR
jgi:hypothetical protein